MNQQVQSGVRVVFVIAGRGYFLSVAIVDKRICWHPKRISCDYFTVLCAFF
jgi:hypothetical protein